MFVRVGQREEVVPVFGIEASERCEDEHLFIFLCWECRRSQIVKLIVDDRRRSADAALGFV